LKTADFDYQLPPELIAQQPLADRAASRLLVLNRATGDIHHDSFRNFPSYIHPGDLLVLNNTKVIPARIWSQRPNVEILLVEPLGNNRWSALVKPGHRAKTGRTLEFTPWLSALVEGEAEFGGRVLCFTGNVESYLQHQGAPPLPPYIDRPTTVADRDRYQTVFAQQPGAVAAPTAGLHFTPEMLAALPHTFITLHVGVGTFRPVKAENVAEHKMHAERFTVAEEAAAAMRAVWSRGRLVRHGGGLLAPTGLSAVADRGQKPAPTTEQRARIIAVGTTVVRTLESLGEPRAATGKTDIFIRPPFQFRVVDALLTNFHLPKSTLLMLVSAFAGRELILRAYAEAVRERYRFFSYGDCMLIL
jgi:S-adenosylmethionine:tRNA ribosyltransferase-isomerase